MDVIPADALVVRGGRNRPEDILRGTGTHPSGVTGISVESNSGVSLEQLARPIPILRSESPRSERSVLPEEM